MDLPKSTVQRSLATLADLGWIRPAGRESSQWTLGERVRVLSEMVDDVGHLRDAALPALGDLNTETMETVHLALAEARTMRLIERMDSKHPLRFVQTIGTRSPFHAASTGKAVLAHLPEQEIADYLGGGLQAITSHTLVDPQIILAELKVIRERGYAVADEELLDGVVSIAASIRPDGGRPIAAVSISGPSSRITPDLHVIYGKKVALAAADISARLSGM